MRATLALRNAHTPLIRFLGKRSVPRTLEKNLPAESQSQLSFFSYPTKSIANCCVQR